MINDANFKKQPPKKHFALKLRGAGWCLQIGNGEGKCVWEAGVFGSEHHFTYIQRLHHTCGLKGPSEMQILLGSAWTDLQR